MGSEVLWCDRGVRRKGQNAVFSGVVCHECLQFAGGPSSPLRAHRRFPAAAASRPPATEEGARRTGSETRGQGPHLRPQAGGSGPQCDPQAQGRPLPPPLPSRSPAGGGAAASPSSDPRDLRGASVQATCFAVSFRVLALSVPFLQLWFVIKTGPCSWARPGLRGGGVSGVTPCLRVPGGGWNRENSGSAPWSSYRGGGRSEGRPGGGGWTRHQKCGLNSILVAGMLVRTILEVNYHCFGESVL